MRRKSLDFIEIRTPPDRTCETSRIPRDMRQNRQLQLTPAEDATAVISYCGSGVTACHNLLALEHAGLGRGRLYAGGWSEYGAEPRRRSELD
jgi:3-mercaptopyruvate sulfurtransferase SseA